MDTAGVDRAVLVPPPLEGYRNDLALEAAHLHPDRFAVMGLFDINAAGARSQIATWRHQPGMLGFRLNFKTGVPPDDWLWAEAEQARLQIMKVYIKELHLGERAAERHPELKLVIDHLGIPRRTKDDKAFAHLGQILALAKHPNIAVKASSLPGSSSDSYPYRR